MARAGTSQMPESFVLGAKHPCGSSSYDGVSRSLPTLSLCQRPLQWEISRSGPMAPEQSGQLGAWGLPPLF